LAAIPAKPASPDAARPSETGFRKLSPEKPVNNAGPVTFSAGIADSLAPCACNLFDQPWPLMHAICLTNLGPLRTQFVIDQLSHDIIQFELRVRGPNLFDEMKRQNCLGLNLFDEMKRQNRLGPNLFDEMKRQNRFTRS
jgi:hypothetical protein